MELDRGEINEDPTQKLLRPTRRTFLRGAGLVGLAAALPPTLRPLQARAETNSATVKALSNANRVLLERGLCLGAWVTTAETGRYIPSAAEWKAIGFNTVVWYEAPYFDAEFLDALPDSTQWGVAVYPNNTGGSHLPGPPPAGTQVLGDAGQRANLDRLFSVCFGDEEGYSDDDVSWVQQWIALGRQQLGNDHLFQNNQYKGQWSESELEGYVGRAEPDLLTYDNYPFGSPSPYAQGNRPEILDGINVYRRLAQGGVDGSGREPIAFGLYTEGYKGGNYDYVPSESEIRFNHHSIWALGGKWAVMFRWENDPGYFFFYRTDGSHTPQFSQFGTTLHQSQLLSPYLVRLQNRDVRIDLGQHQDATTGTATQNAQPSTVDLWDAYATPYLSSITVKNTGGANHGLRGDAILSTFVPLPVPSGTKPQPLPAVDAAFMAAPNTKFLMLLNGLSAPNSQGGYDAVDGFAAQTRQQFTLTLPRIADRPTQVRAVDLKTGHLVSLPSVSHTKTADTVQLELDGGTSTLLCIRTGGPTVDDGPTLDLTTSQPVTQANGRVELTATLTNSTPTAIGGISTRLDLPDGWSASPAGPVTTGKLAAGSSTKIKWTIQSPDDAGLGRYPIQALTNWPYAPRTDIQGGVKASTELRIERSGHYVYSQQADESYKRLTREIAVPAGGGSMTFWTDYDTEQSWDFLFVEAHTPNQDDWTTLPDANGHTTTSTGGSGPAGWVQLHQQLAHYQTWDGKSSCTPTGTTGSWNAATGSSGGWQQWKIDLSNWAGKTVEVSISYASDWGTQGAGVWLDDIVLPDGTTSTFEDGALDGWLVPGAPAGSATNSNDFTVVDSADVGAP